MCVCVEGGGAGSWPLRPDSCAETDNGMFASAWAASVEQSAGAGKRRGEGDRQRRQKIKEEGQKTRTSKTSKTSKQANKDEAREKDGTEQNRTRTHDAHMLPAASAVP